MKLSIDEINALDVAGFTARLGHVCEHAPWVARRAAERRPFASCDELHRGLVDAIDQASDAEQLDILRNHPELAGKAAIAGELTADSKKEQSGAGLDRLTPAEYERFHALNRAYTAKFGFPFILAVKGRTKDEILAAFQARVAHDRATELRTALDQVGRIIGFRVADLVA